MGIFGSRVDGGTDCADRETRRPRRVAEVHTTGGLGDGSFDWIAYHEDLITLVRRIVATRS